MTEYSDTIPIEEWMTDPSYATPVKQKEKPTEEAKKAAEDSKKDNEKPPSDPINDSTNKNEEPAKETEAKKKDPSTAAELWAKQVEEAIAKEKAMGTTRPQSASRSEQPEEPYP